MIKFTIIFVIVYFVLWILTKIGVEGASVGTKLRIALNNPPKSLQYWFAVLGLMKILSIIFVAISVILLVVCYL